MSGRLFLEVWHRDAATGAPLMVAHYCRTCARAVLAYPREALAPDITETTAWFLLDHTLCAGAACVQGRTAQQGAA